MKTRLVTSETTQIPKKIISKGIKYSDKYCKIENFKADFGSFHKDYLLVHYSKKASIVLVKNNKILMTKQYRLLINKLSLEVPGGALEKKEKPSQAAKRECLEETGIKCKNLKPLVQYFTALEYIKNYNYIFFTNKFDIKNIKPNCVWVPLKNCLKMIKNKKIHDSLSIISILYYLSYKKKI